jgi:hypothetical protein
MTMRTDCRALNAVAWTILRHGNAPRDDQDDLLLIVVHIHGLALGFFCGWIVWGGRGSR